MISPGSRYESADHVFTQAHLYNAYGQLYLDGDTSNLKVLTVSRETLYLVATPVITQTTPNQEYFVKDGEGIQWLGFKFMQDPKRWTEVALANPDVWYPLDLPMGTYIQVPPST